MGRSIWKPWTLEIVGRESGIRSQLTFYRFWSKEAAQKAADKLNARNKPPASETTHFEAALLRK